MDLGLQDKVAVVLASTAGLGLASARALASEGARVAISGRDEKRLWEAHSQLEHEFPGRVIGERLDVVDSAAMQAHISRIRDRWGAVDVLVTNAGGPKPAAAAELGDDDLRAAFELTMRSTIAAIRCVLPAMRAQHWGRIIALTSSSVRQPIAGLALSNAFRAGLTGYLKTLSSEVAREGVLVNSICTGMFDTDRLRELFDVRAAKSGRTAVEERAAIEREIPVGRIGRVEEFGALVAFLASERASFLCGLALPIDGGASRSLY